MEINDKQYRIIKIILAIVFLVILYLFALSKRYVPDGDNKFIILDRWTGKTAIVVPTRK